MKKIISLALAAAMVVSAVPMAYAVDTQDYTQGTQVSYTAANAEAYTITVPASMQPGDEGTVTLQGTWASDRIVTVTADKTVTLINSINAADQKTLDIGFSGMEYAGNNTEAKTYTETVSVADMPASALFGTWSGKVNYNVGIADYINLNPDDGSTPADGDVYTAGDYKYTYAANKSGWAVALNTEVTDKNQTSYGAILESINGKPVTNMDRTFLNCTSLTTAPEIPAGVTNMSLTFQGCTGLTAAPEIPAGVTRMNQTFHGCTDLTTAPEIPDSVTSMPGTFYNCIRLTAAPEIPANVTNMDSTFYNCAGLTGEISIPCSLASQNYTYADCPATITYYHIDGCDGSCGQ